MQTVFGAGRNKTRFAWTTAVALVALVFTVLPTPQMSVQAQSVDCSDLTFYPWMDTSRSADERAQLLLAASTLDQKIRWLDEHSANNPQQTVFPIGGGQSVTLPAQVPCTPTIQYTDSPTAITGAGAGVTAFPSQVGLSASWDLDLAYEKGVFMGHEAFRKQRTVLLGPGLASGRDPRSGRTSEYLGEDPILAGLFAAAYSNGVGANDAEPVLSTLKHYVANEQEIDRNSSSSNMDERTLREIYTLPFEIAIKEGNVGSVMCSFNQVSGKYACENDLILDTILKQEIGFQGYVMTDFGSVHSLNSNPPSLIAGLDQELNRWRFWSPDLLKQAIADGRITEADIDEAAFRVVRSHIAAGLFDVPRLTVADPDVSTLESEAFARRLAEASSVLLKNDGILPLNVSGQTIAVIGPTASNTPVQVLNTYGGGGFGPPSPTVNLSAASVCSHAVPGVPCTPISPLDGITARAAQEGNTVVFNNGSDPASAAVVAAEADVAIVFGYYREGEFTDRPHISLDHVSLDDTGDSLVSAVAAANPNTIVVLQTGGPVLMPWLDSVKAILEVWYAGEQMGPAIAALLWGDVNPSGKLTHTFPVSEADLPTAGSPAQYPGIFNETGTTTPPSPRAGAIRQVEYTEGLLVGYRWYDAQGIEPLFPFGFGLSYTTFEYSNLRLNKKSSNANQALVVKADVTNTGSVIGTEIVQVYISLPAETGEPPKRLVDWARVTLEPGQTKNVTITINPNSSLHPTSYWNPDSYSWEIAGGNYTVYVGSSSRDLPLTGTVTIMP